MRGEASLYHREQGQADEGVREGNRQVDPLEEVAGRVPGLLVLEVEEAEKVNQNEENVDNVTSEFENFYEKVTLESLGQEFGVSKERVRQLEARALGSIKDAISSYVDQPSDLY